MPKKRTPAATSKAPKPAAQPGVIGKRIASAIRPLADGRYDEFVLVEGPSPGANLEMFWLRGRSPADYKYISAKPEFSSPPATHPCQKILISENPQPVKIANLNLCEDHTLGITHFVLYSESGEPLFVLNVVGAKSYIDWVPQPGNDPVLFRLEGEVRNFFKSDENKALVTLVVKIRKKKNDVIRYKSILLKNGGTIVGDDEEFQFTGIKPEFEWRKLKDEILNLREAVIPKEDSDFEDKFPAALGLDLIDKKEDRQVRVTFGYPIKTPGEGGRTLHSLKFTSEIKTEADPNAPGELRIFGEGKFNVGSQHLVDQRLKFVQYPARSLDAYRLAHLPESAVRAEWIVQVQLPANVFYGAWNERISGEYYKSLKLIKSGHKLSFLPRFEPGQPGVERWTVAYRLTDSIAYEHEFESKPGSGQYKFKGEYEQPGFTFAATPGGDEIRVEELTVQPDVTYLRPNVLRKVTAIFEHLQTHEREPLRSALTLDVTLIDGGIADCDQEKGTHALYARFEAENREFDKKIVVPVAGDVYSFGRSQIRMGALDIGFAEDRPPSAPPAPAACSPKPNGPAGREFTGIIVEHYARDLFTVDIRRVNLAVSRINAGGQDDLPLEEFVPPNSVTSNLRRNKFLGNDQEIIQAVKSFQNCKELPRDDVNDLEAAIEARFRRARPLVINPRAGAGTNVDHQARYALRVDEQTQEQGSQTIRLSLQQKSVPSPADIYQAIVLDNEPFLVAEVQFKPFAVFEGNTDQEVATWTNAAFEGAGWQLASYSNPITLILPPQGVGEAMEKAKNITPGKSVDFRLSPPAEIELDPSRAPKIFFDKEDVGKPRQKFNEPPWNLRRIMGFPGQTSPGLEIKHLQFELLYGLSCDSEFPLLRLAEITSLLGAIPGRMRPIANAETCAYLRARVEWAHLYNLYSSRIAIFEPWTEQQVGQLLLNKSTVCRIRSDKGEQDRANLEKPLRPLGARAELYNPVAPADKQQSQDDLKGGVTWGFESRNVYNAVMTPGKSKNPESDPQTTSVSDLHFSSFGGWGRVKAPFDEKRSTIYGDVSMGRTYTYKLERIGRIGCWWNVAQHVIVYERTVMPSRQMQGMQEGLKGLPVVRKVREYVKILQARRDYPDGEAASTPELARQRGCVKACLFKEGAEFNVLSSWGADVGDVGWKVPLWNRNALPKDVYPEPEVQLELLSNVGGASTPDPCTIDNPENLYFYTDTQAGTGADPNKWLPVKDVDFVDVPAPRPSGDFKSGLNVQTTPDDPVVHPGMALCTFLLKPNAVPADLVAGRVGKPLAAVLRSVTMMRANFREFSGADEAYHKLVNLREAAVNAHRDILTDIARGVDRANLKVDARINPVMDELGRIGGGFADLKKKLSDKVTAYESNSFRRLRDKYEELLGEGKINFERTYTDLVNEINDINNSPPVEEIRRRGLQLFRALQEGQMLLNGSPGALQRALNQYAPTFQQWFTAYTEWIDAVKRTGDEVSAFLTGLPDDIVEPQLTELKNRLRRFRAEADKLQASLNKGDLRRVVEWLPGPVAVFNSNYAEVVLKDFQAKNTEARDKVEEMLRAELKVTKEQAQKTADIYRDDLAAFRTRFDAARQKLEQDVKGFGDIESELEKLKEKLNSEIAKKFESAVPAELKAAVLEIKTKADTFRTELTNFEKEVAANATKVFNEWKFDNAQYAIDKLKGELDQIKDQIKKIPASAAADLFAEVTRARDQFLKEAENFVEANVRALMPDKDVYAVADKIPKLIRAFGQPPEVPNLTFDRPQLAYFYDKLSDKVDLTPVLSRVAQANQAVEALKPLGIALPTEALLDKLVPPDLKNFRLSDIMPKFAGLDLSNLFSGLKMPDMSNDNLRISHGLDPQARRAWVAADVKVQFAEDATVFSIGPVILQLKGALFDAKVLFETFLGQPPRKTVYGSIKGEWHLVVANIPVVIFKETELKFDESGKFRFNLSPANVELPEIMSFVSEFLKTFTDPDSGFSIGLTKMGIRAILSLPIPDVQGATSGFSNLILGMSFGLDFSDGFKISVGFSLGRKETPFAVTIFILGGGGYMEVTVNYTPATRKIDCEVDIGIVVSASVAIALGPIKGGVYVYFGITARYVLRPGDPENSGLTVGVLYLIRGQVSILGLVSASVSLMLEATYRNKKLTGRGRFSIKIKICWCFTLEVSEQVEYTLGGGGGSGGRNLDGRREDRAALGPPTVAPIPAFRREAEVGRAEPLYRNAAYRAEPAPPAPPGGWGGGADDVAAARRSPGRRPAGAASPGRSMPLRQPPGPNYREKAGHYIDMLSED